LIGIRFDWQLRARELWAAIQLGFWGTSMRKAFWLCLALVAVLGFATSGAFARGGGHGGGHHGGGHRGGHHSSHHSSHHHTGHHDHSHHGYHHHYHHSNWAHHNHPFSRGWYGRHGGTWGYGWGGWGWGNPWAISTFGATAAWLGMDAASPYYGSYGTAPVDNVLTSDSDDLDSPAAPTTDESIASETPLPESTPEQIAAASELAASGKQDPPKNTTFLPLGVFSIAPQGQTEASALVQLAVSKDGLLRGSYYDLLTDHDQPIRGTVNKKTQEVAFTFGINGKVTFETTLPNLTQDKGTLAAHFENGKTSTWTLARYEKEPTEKETGATTVDGELEDSDSDDSENESPTAEPKNEAAPQ
jgi:hypothetical protein